MVMALAGQIEVESQTEGERQRREKKGPQFNLEGWLNLLPKR